MKNIRGALFVLSLSIVLLFNSITIAQAKAPSENIIVICKSTTYGHYAVQKFTDTGTVIKIYKIH